MDHRLSPKDLSRAQFLAERLLLLAAAVATLGVLFANPAAAASTTDVYTAQPVYLFGIPVDFILFGLTLLGVAIFHHKTCVRKRRALGVLAPLIPMSRVSSGDWGSNDQ